MRQEWKVGYCNAIFWGNEGNKDTFEIEFTVYVVWEMWNSFKFKPFIFIGKSTEIHRWWSVSRYCHIYNIAQGEISQNCSLLWLLCYSIKLEIGQC